MESRSSPRGAKTKGAGLYPMCSSTWIQDKDFTQHDEDSLTIEEDLQMIIHQNIVEDSHLLVFMIRKPTNVKRLKL